MALRLAKAFHSEERMWLSLQQAYDLWQMEEKKQGILDQVEVVPFPGDADAARQYMMEEPGILKAQETSADDEGQE